MGGRDTLKWSRGLGIAQVIGRGDRIGQKRTKYYEISVFMGQIEEYVKKVEEALKIGFIGQYLYQTVKLE